MHAQWPGLIKEGVGGKGNPSDGNLYVMGLLYVRNGEQGGREGHLSSSHQSQGQGNQVLQRARM